MVTHFKLSGGLRLWRRELRPTVRLALPIVAGLVGHTIIGLTDTIMVGRVGVDALAAATLVNALGNLPLIFGMGLLSSIAVLTAQAHGARRPLEAGEVLRHGLLISGATGVSAAVLLLCCFPFLPQLGQPPEVIAEAGAYLVLFAVSLFPALLAHGGKQFSDALRHPWAPTWIMGGGVFLNALLNWIFIYGHWGMPALGLTGAGWATVLSRLAIAGCMVSYILCAPKLRSFMPPAWWAAVSPRRFLNLLQLGGPVAAQHLLEVSAFAIAALMMGWISAVAIAAHQIAITCAATTFMFPLGIGQAVCIRVGHAFGARQYRRMRRIGFSGAAMAIAIMGVFGLVLMSMGRPIAGLFIRSPEVVGLATQLLLVAALFQVADGLQVVSISALRGLSDVSVPALIAMLAYWAVALPLGWMLAFAADGGALGIWIGLATGLAIAAISLSWRFHARTSLKRAAYLAS